MMSAVGKKNSTAASTHRLIDDVPLCAAAAIQRGPSTAAMLNSSTSQKPITRRSPLLLVVSAKARLLGEPLTISECGFLVRAAVRLRKEGRHKRVRFSSASAGVGKRKGLA